jgi:hypothetical protein
MNDNDMHYDRAEIPLAHSFDVLFCGGCPNAHLVFFDKRDRPLLQAIITVAQARCIIERIRARDPNFKDAE